MKLSHGDRSLAVGEGESKFQKQNKIHTETTNASKIKLLNFSKTVIELNCSIARLTKSLKRTFKITVSQRQLQDEERQGYGRRRRAPRRFIAGREESRSPCRHSNELLHCSHMWTNAGVDSDHTGWPKKHRLGQFARPVLSSCPSDFLISPCLWLKKKKRKKALLCGETRAELVGRCEGLNRKHVQIASWKEGCLLFLGEN